MDGGAERAPYDWRRLLTLQFGSTANEELVFPAYGAPDGECYNIISAFKLITNLIKGDEFGVEARGLVKGSKEELAEALATFIFVDNARAFVTLGELARFQEAHRVLLPNFNKQIHKRAEVIERGSSPGGTTNTKALREYVEDPKRKNRVRP